MRELENQARQPGGTLIVFDVGHHDGYQVTVDNVVRDVENPNSAQSRELIASRSVNKVRHPRGSYI